MAKRVDLVQDKFAHASEWKKVTEIADALEAHLRLKSVQKSIAAANRPGASSSQVQDVLLGRALELGFRDEAKGLFKDYKNKGLRPDFFLNLGNTGIILEVERGKTNQNNMDFLDFWKCHICVHAHYLFLFVPLELKQNSKGSASKPFSATLSHLEAFFEPQNYTNVRGMVLFGY